MTQWMEFDRADDVALAVADTIAESSIQAIRQRGTFKIVLAGGTTPLTSYQLLAGRALDFEHWQVFYGDERCLPEHDPQRNHRLVAGTGLSERVGRHFIIPAQLGPEKGAESYAHTVNTAVPFDLVLLGMGEDGHTASLFPALDWERKRTSARVIPVHGAPKPPPQRISLSLSCLQDCRQMMVIVTGQGKRSAVQQWRQGVLLPVAQVSAVSQATVFIERGLLS